MKAIILCGGAGLKIWPYNTTWQKACLPVGNIPNVIRIIRQLKGMGIGHIDVLISHMEQQVRYLLRNETAVNIITAREENLSAAILGFAQEDDDCLVYYGDIYCTDKDLQGLLDCFIQKGSSALLKGLDGNYNSEDYICAKEENGLVQSFYGHPREHYVNAKVGGVFIVSKEVLQYAAYSPGTFLNVCVGGMPPSGFFFEQCLHTAIEDGHRIHAVYTTDSYVDMDFPWDIMTANQLYCRDVVGALEKDEIGQNATISEKATIKGHIVLGENSMIGDRVVIEGNCIIGANTSIDNGAIIGANSVIGSHTIVKDYCKISPETVVGNKNKVGFSAEVTGVTFDSVSMVHNSEVFGIVGRNTDIAAGCQMGIMRFDDRESIQKAPVKKYTGKNVNGIFLGDYCRTGIGNLFMPGIKVGTHSALGAGLIVEKDVPENKMLLVKQTVAEVDWDYRRYGW